MRDLRCVHQRRRMAAAGDLDRAARVRPAPPGPRRFISRDRLCRQQVRVLAAQDEHRDTRSRPTAATARCRIRSASRSALRWPDRSESEAAASASAARCARQGDATARRSETRTAQDLAQVRLGLVDRFEAASACAGSAPMRRSAAAETRAPKSLRTRLRIGEPASAASSMPMWPPSDVPIQSTCLDIEPGDQRGDRTQVGAVGVVRWRRQPIAAAAPRQVGRDHAGAVSRPDASARTSKSRPLRETPCTQTTVALGLRRTPLGVRQAAEAAAAEHRHLLEAGLHGPR